jgi:adenine-specific DNA-methyltransferase
MLNLACRNTAKLVRAKVESENVRLGRLFTKKDTARRMAAMFALNEESNACTILDPGAGTGILSAALIERICKEAPRCKQIFLTCYETLSRELTFTTSILYQQLIHDRIANPIHKLTILIISNLCLIHPKCINRNPNIIV